MRSAADLPVIGLDLANSVFQLHTVNVETGEIQRRQIKRAMLTEFFAKCQPGCKAANLSNSHDAKTCPSWADDVGDSRTSTGSRKRNP